MLSTPHYQRNASQNYSEVSLYISKNGYRQENDDNKCWRGCGKKEPFCIAGVGFPGGSDCKESICNAGDAGSISGLGRSPGEGIGYLLQYSWASLVAQMVKDLPAMWETWVQSLGWEDPLEKGMATHSSILAWRNETYYSHIM